MTLIVFLAAIVLWAILRHQLRRHALELAQEGERLGLRMAEPPRDVPALESLLTVLVGIALVVPSAFLLADALGSSEAGMWKHFAEFLSAGMAAGFALVILGIRALLAHRTPASAPTAGPPASS